MHARKAFLKGNYTFLVQRIATLESSQLTLCETLRILADTRRHLANVEGERGEQFRLCV